MKLRVSDGVDPVQTELAPRQLRFSPPFECSDVPFVLDATEAVEFSQRFSGAIGYVDPACSSFRLWNALRAKATASYTPLSTREARTVRVVHCV